ncbi:hypothetical protein ERX35_007940 [Macrococcus equipercicus]|uniref:Uncharacterized protein n=1 Tax=Macrococcus equipercicus TaxID=69967 RepID=A0ABQ6R7Q9_9STAP|nr:hypothetical protein [Macrococcus equipercicus]KAA1039136.1 hypothetical protein ERX35_007940 [Macrococcus equipercicus]
MKLFKVTFETHPTGNPLFLFHPCFYVEAPSINEAPKQAQKAFNLNPANIPLTREIVEIKVLTYKGVSEESIFRYEERGADAAEARWERLKGSLLNHKNTISVLRDMDSTIKYRLYSSILEEMQQLERGEDE